jgi:hypothetical protein
MNELEPLSVPILLVDNDATWPKRFRHEAEKIRTALRERALRIEHVGPVCGTSGGMMLVLNSLNRIRCRESDAPMTSPESKAMVAPPGCEQSWSLRANQLLLPT